MVKGETYYRKFQSTPTVVLSGYSGTWKLTQNGQTITNFSGVLLKTDSYYELTFETALLGFGDYRLECFNVFPDGFIECINDEIISVS